MIICVELPFKYIWTSSSDLQCEMEQYMMDLMRNFLFIKFFLTKSKSSHFNLIPDRLIYMQIPNDRSGTNIEKVLIASVKGNKNKTKNSRFRLAVFETKTNASFDTKSNVWLFCLHFHRNCWPISFKLFIYFFIECHKLLQKYFVGRIKFNPFALLISCQTIYLHIFFRRNFLRSVFTLIEVNPKKFYHLHFKRNNTKKKKQQQRTNKKK